MKIAMKTMIKKIHNLIHHLENLTTDEDIEQAFADFNLDDYMLRIQFLREAMQIQEVYDDGVVGETATDGSIITEKDLYEDEKSIFLSGIWKQFV